MKNGNMIMMMFLIDLIVLLSIFSFAQFMEKRQLTTDYIQDTVSLSSSLTLLYDPPDQHVSPTALGVYVQSNDPSAVIYYEFDGSMPTFSSPYVTVSTPYIEMDTPYLASRNRSITIVAVQKTYDGYARSEQYTLNYYIEATNRPYSYGFLVPGIETSGYFLKIGLEMVAVARAQAAGTQEFADFFTELGVGTYSSQVTALHLPSLDPDLTGFEGGVPVNTSDNSQYGILAPYHNGKIFHGKVVRINLKDMDNVTYCQNHYRMESLDSDGNIIVTGSASRSTACIFVLDLSTLHSLARGFRRLFTSYPYVYLSPGEFNVPVRLDMENFGIDTAIAIDLDTVDSTLGGYSGGFTDGSWACFNPLRTFFGPVGGIRSKLPVDSFHLRHYYHGRMLCINESGWLNPSNASAHVRYLDMSDMSPELRGYSDAIRVGRYAYLCPFGYDRGVYSGKLIRISLGMTDIGVQLDALAASRLPISSIVTVLDLALSNPSLLGFSSIFTSGQSIYLVPFRNSDEPSNGQRGHGNFVVINMNDFSLNGVSYIDLAATTRNQIPSFYDIDLRGFSFGFASGKYAVLVPFYNAIFSGKLARVVIVGSTLSSDLQELNTVVDRTRPNIYKGYRGGFVSIWQGVAY